MLTNIATNERYTLYAEDSFGLPWIANVKITDVKEVQYRDYQTAPVQNAVRLSFIVKGKRQAIHMTIKKNTRIAMWKGWLNVNTMERAVKNTHTEGAYIISETESHSLANMEKAIEIAFITQGCAMPIYQNGEEQ